MSAMLRVRDMSRSRASSLVGHVRGVGAALVLAAATAVLSVPANAAAAAGPVVYTGAASNVTATSVVLHGGIDPKGKSTSYVFQYGPRGGGYSAQTALTPVGGGTATVRVTQTVNELQPASVYHYRIVATGSGGVIAGGERTFQTAKIPLSLQIAGTPNPVPFGAPFAVQGTLFGTGAAGRPVQLQINPFPYTAGFKPYGNPEVTSATGSFSFPVVGLLENAQLRVATTTGKAVVSSVLTEGVAVRVVLRAQRVQRHRRGGRFYRLYGTVAPAEVGASVGFQWLRAGAPSVNQGGTYVTPGTSTVSRFGTIVRVRHPGLYEALVLVRDGSHVSAYSAPVRLG